MTLRLLTLDFHRTPISLREKLAFSERVLPEALGMLQHAGATECAILSTCNRVELVMDGNPALDSAVPLSFLSEWHRVPASVIERHARYLTDQEAANHLIRVACGLESLVPGEMQILGQVKEAAKVARKSGTLGPSLDRLFAFALGAGRRARTETGIARRPVSISHAAIALIQERFNRDLSGRKVLLVGSGKMGEVAAQQLHKAGAAHFIVANRTYERACMLARQWDGTPLPLHEMPQVLAQVDAVIAATGAPHLVIHRHHIAEAMKVREGRELLLVDLAVPRDIDPSASDIPGVTLRDVDGLQAVVVNNIALRNGERETVERIVRDELERYQVERAARTVAPTITNLRESAEQIRQAELEKTLGRLGHLNERDRAIVEALSHSLINKLLHEPTVRLRQKAATEEAIQFQRTVEELFALKGPQSEA